MNIFLDVGANTGQTLEAVRDWGFDRIICFEPSRVCWNTLQATAQAVRPPCLVTLHQYGLWHTTCEAILFEPGRAGAGLWKKDRSTRDTTDLCRFQRASDWFRDYISESDIVYMKLNCEGAECDILDDLLDTQEFRKVSYFLIHFDVRKIASQRHREGEIRHRLAQWHFPRIAFAEDVMIGATHAARIQHWLGSLPPMK